jgi:LysM repeat protein
VGLAKAIIQPESPPGAQAIVVLFNPTTYGLDKANTFDEATVPGLGSPILQFIGGGAQTLTMDLFFDTYEAGKDVRDHTHRIYGLLAIERTTHAPPVCAFRWGTFRFRCVLERVSGQFTLFFDDGRPARATLSVTFREVVDVQAQIRSAPTESADHTTTHVVKRDNTLSAVAAAEYGDARAWRPIAEANGIDNPRRLAPGQALVVPPLVRRGEGA